jgi:hypothetical protein
VAWEGVSIALNDPALEPDPTWTRIDSTDNLVASYTIDRGRQYELDQTDTGRASVVINDVDGILDPTNAVGPYYGQIEPLLQIAIALHNPVSDNWKPLFRGFIEDFDYTVDPSLKVNRLTINCVDAFAILEAIELTGSAAGDPAPAFGNEVSADQEGDVFYEAKAVDDRILQALADAGWDTSMSRIFSGNVSCADQMASSGDSLLSIVRDAADAEFPGLGNVYVSREGYVTFHGRMAKFTPEDVAATGDWVFTEWKAGDAAAVAADGLNHTAHIRELAFNRGLSKIINQATCTPSGILDADVPGQTVRDLTSQGFYGIRSWSATDLVILEGTTTGNSAKDECKAFAQYWINNMASPQNRISQLGFRAIDPSSAHATPNWTFLCNAEISDRVLVTVAFPGGGGFTAEPFFIEGVHYDVTPLNEDYHDVKLTLDVSPAGYYNDSSGLT